MLDVGGIHYQHVDLARALIEVINISSSHPLLKQPFAKGLGGKSAENILARKHIVAKHKYNGTPKTLQIWFQREVMVLFE